MRKKSKLNGLLAIAVSLYISVSSCNTAFALNPGFTQRVSDLEQFKAVFDQAVDAGITDFTIHVATTDLDPYIHFLDRYLELSPLYSYSLSSTTYPLKKSAELLMSLEYDLGYEISSVIKDPSKIVSQKALDLVPTVQKILSGLALEGKTDYEKVKAVHDYIVLNTAYDDVNYGQNTVPEESYSVYGVLVNHVAVCDGYAKTFQMFMDILGIPCQKVNGYGKGVLHAWNLIQLDGEYYHIDTTWDDPYPDQKGKVSYVYFNVNDSLLSKTHVWTREDYPQSLGAKYFYYRQAGIYFESTDEFKAYAKQKLANGETILEAYYPKMKNNPEPLLEIVKSLLTPRAKGYQLVYHFDESYIWIEIN